MSWIHRRLTVFLHDLAVVILAFALAFFTWLNFEVESQHWEHFREALPFVAIAQGAVLVWFRLYRGLWRFASIHDLWNIVRASVTGTAVVGFLLFLVNRLEGVPRATLVLYPLFLIPLLGAPRLGYRIWKNQRIRLIGSTNRKRVLLIGAGRAGEMLARDMARGNEYLPVAFLDDNRLLKNAKIQGIPVVGSVNQLEIVAKEFEVDVVIIAMPSANGSEMQKVVKICERSGVQFRTLPRLSDMMSGQPTIEAIRDVSIDDLLGRNTVSLDWTAISSGLGSQSVLVTGGGGSIGSELCRQIANLNPVALVILEKSEYNLYLIDLELRKEFPNLALHSQLGDVSDPVCVDHIFAEFRPSIVFHAAAYKHVPMLQFQVREALKNNVLGTHILARAADRYGVGKFVMVSTDKAVNPTNIMGATKRIGEIYCQNLNKCSKTAFITVRFGNVLGSAGSVVPLFKKQIERGGPVTVTHPDMTRYFMTIPEACQLIMQAGSMGEGGEIFVLDMGAPVKISYLAEQMIRLSGKTLGEDIRIEYCGLRPGEKLYEELFHEQENLAPTSHGKILLARSRHVEWDFLEKTFDGITQACNEYDETTLRRLLTSLVPEFKESGLSANPNKWIPVAVEGNAAVGARVVN